MITKRPSAFDWRRDTDANIGMTYMLLAQGNKLLAIEHFEQAMMAAEDHATRVSFGNALQNVGFFREASAQYVRAIELKPDRGYAQEPRSNPRIYVDNNLSTH
jgi:tetratricopeptide (TPR) repeat protein